jgi:hypothetical protein
MSLDLMSGDAQAQVIGAPPLVVLRQPHSAMGGQQAFATGCARVMLKAGVSGHRLVIALHITLTRHAPAVAVADDGTVHLTCGECRPDCREPAAQYPCPTAQQAFWALDAILS